MTEMKLSIKTENNKERYKIAASVHDSLVGDPDYIYNRIVLNLDDDRVVRIYMDNSVDTIKMRTIFNTALEAAQN